MFTIIFIIILSFLVIIHELGHFLAAKWAKIKVEEFGLGFPPRAAKLFSWRKTLFSLNWIPFGGFVKMEGEEEQGAVEKKIKLLTKNKNKEGPFYQKSTLQRLVVIVAGASVNFIFGIIAFSIFFSFTGIPTPLDQPRIAETSEGSPAREAGLPSQVNIIGLRAAEEFYSTNKIQDVVDRVNEHKGENVTLLISGPCSGLSCAESVEEVELYLRTPEETPTDQGSMGVIFETTYMRFFPWYEMPFRGMAYGLTQALFFSLLILQALGQLLVELFTRGSIPDGLAGPVGIVSQASKGGFSINQPLDLLGFAGMLSINLAVMNLLPIPALDGGRAVFVLLEQVVGRKIVSRVERYANYGGYVVLLTLIIMVTIRDVLNIFR